MAHFDDLLSVVNDAQLKSALNAYKEITQLMKRASEQRKRKAGDKLTVCILEKILITMMKIILMISCRKQKEAKCQL